MLLFIYLRRAFVGLRTGVGGLQSSIRIADVFRRLMRFQFQYPSKNARRFAPRKDEHRIVVGLQNPRYPVFGARVALNTLSQFRNLLVEFLHVGHSAILQAASLKRNGPVVPVHAGGNA